MKKILILMAFCLTSVYLFASLQPNKVIQIFSDKQILINKQDSLAWIDGYSAVNSTVEFDIIPQNSSAKVGVLFRHVSDNDWIYVGCDKATDHIGFAYWYVETPKGKYQIARDIAKLYAHYRRHIKVNCSGRIVEVYVDGEQIAHKYIPDLPLVSGKVGFRVHDEGHVQISNVKCHAVEEIRPNHAQNKKGYTLSSSFMDVVLNRDFPSVQYYHWKDNHSNLSGQPFNVKLIKINGDCFLPKVTSKVEADQILYTLKVKEIDVSVTVCCKITDNIFQLAVTNIEERGNYKVKTIAFPNHNLVSVSNDVPGGCLSVANHVFSDTFIPLKKKKTDDTYQSGTIVILNSDKLAATLESNSLYATRQFLYQSVQTNNSIVTGIWGNEWIYRGHDGEVVELPYIKVILASDSNHDKKVDWQDGAFALRRIYPKPIGTDEIQNSYVTITINFASCAQYPFLRQLDNIKKFYLATDGFGQLLELKGYQSEGHDSAHPDYAGNYNERAGGRKDLAFLAAEARNYNARIGVHINQSESYPEANAFNNQTVTDMPAWRWLDQSYFINKEADMLSGNFEQRLNQLKEEIPNLSFIYIDTYREYRWLAYQTARLFNKHGWAVWSEDTDVFDKEAVWIHGPRSAKSLIHRFVHHQYRDGYAAHPALLGGYDRGKSIGFMGWQKGKDFYEVIRNFFTKQLPYRYLMHYPIEQLNQHRAVLESNLLAFNDGTNGTVIRRGDFVLMKDDCIFIPWDPKTEKKIYHYNAKGGKTTWRLPLSWNGQRSVYLYQLTNLGRKFITTLPVLKGQIEIDALPDQGYVVYKHVVDPSPKINWSEGSLVKDMGFDSQTFDSWKKQDESSHLSIKETTYGQNYLTIEGKEKASVSQTINGLIPGKDYVASVWVNVIGHKKAQLSVRSGNQLHENVSIEESQVTNYTENTDRLKTTWQRLKLPFRMPDNQQQITLSLSGGIAADAAASVCFDDVRLVECVRTEKKGYDYYEDFEHVDEGWGPFIASKLSPFTTHLSEKHGHFTTNTLHGKWSLCTWREKNGEILRTSPSIIRFAPKQEYQIELDYKVDQRDVYRLIGKSFSSDKEIFSYDLNCAGDLKVQFTTPDCTDFYIAVIKNGEGMLVLDNFGIKGRLVK